MAFQLRAHVAECSPPLSASRVRQTHRMRSPSGSKGFDPDLDILMLRPHIDHQIYDPHHAVILHNWSMVNVSEVSADDARLAKFLEVHHWARIARRGELVDARKRQLLVALDDDEMVGALAYDIVGTDCEIVVMRASGQWGGVGTALIDRLEEVARGRGCSRLWLVTTNDNLDAIRFYQRRGFRLSALRCGAVDEARRTLKPEIPELGTYDIPLRDELEFERAVD